MVGAEKAESRPREAITNSWPKPMGCQHRVKTVAIARQTRN